MLSERNVDGVVRVWRMIKHTDKQEVGAEGKSLAKVLLVVTSCEISTRTVKN